MCVFVCVIVWLHARVEHVCVYVVLCVFVGCYVCVVGCARV